MQVLTAHLVLTSQCNVHVVSIVAYIPWHNQVATALLDFTAMAAHQCPIQSHVPLAISVWLEHLLKSHVHLALLQVCTCCMLAIVNPWSGREQ